MRGLGWTTFHDPEHLPRVLAGLREAAAAGKPWEDTFPLRGKDGQYRWYLSRVIPIRSQDGSIVRWFGTNTDVTQLRRLQEALEATDRRKDEFLAMLAHELRNPVAPIMSAAEVLSRSSTTDAKARACVEVIQRQTSHLSRLLDDLLDIARITQAIETAEPLIREKGQQLTVVRPASPPFVNADRVRIAQSIANILLNAAKYTDRGGQIRVTILADAAHATVEVSDTGVGISAELLPVIFDLFVQSERPLDRTEGGLGIGLAVCRNLIEMHQGTVHASSPGANRGATFTIRLPLAESAAESPERGDSASAQRLRILIVDDNRDAADILALLLESEGHRAIAVYEPADALQQLAAYKPDVVLLDIGLPGMDGYEIARRMRAAAHPARLIALSGYGQPQDRLRSSAAGFDAHLVKPVDTESLRQVLTAGKPR
jgi:signal transduction histidine kinase